jgi:hypothetical protein
MERIEINGIEIAKVIGQPIDSNIPVPIELTEICDLDTAEFGEDVYYFSAYDDNTDTVYTSADSGEITSTKKSPSGATALTFVGRQSDLAYVTIHELQDSKDNTALGRKKGAITRSMDKDDVKRVLDLILAVASQEVSAGSGEDLYDAILKMIHKVVDYGDNFILLVGSTVWEKINSYDKENADNFNYRVGIKEMLASNGVKVVKVTGSTVTLDSGAAAAVLAATKGIMVARDSKIQGVGGKPCLFVRRKINPEVATLLGIEPDKAERLITTIGGLQVINNSKNILGYGVVGYEAVIQAITNYKACAWCADFNI